MECEYNQQGDCTHLDGPISCQNHPHCLFKAGYKKGRESVINKKRCHECSVWEETYHKFCANCGRKVTKGV